MNDILWGTVSVRPTHPLQMLTASIHKCTWTVKGRWKLSLLWGIKKKACGLSPGWNDAFPYLTHKEAGKLPWIGNNMALYKDLLETISPECRGFWFDRLIVGSGLRECVRWLGRPGSCEGPEGELLSHNSSLYFTLSFYKVGVLKRFNPTFRPDKKSHSHEKVGTTLFQVPPIYFPLLPHHPKKGEIEKTQ